MKKKVVTNHKAIRLPLVILLPLWILFKLGQLPFNIVNFLIRSVVALRPYLEIETFAAAERIKKAGRKPKQAKKMYQTVWEFLNTDIPLPKISLPKLSLPKSQPTKKIAAQKIVITPQKTKTGIFKRGRGRPRTQAFWPFYLKKAKRFLNKIFPKPLRWAVGLIIVFGVIFSYSFVLIDVAHTLPSPDQLTSVPQPKTTQIYDRNGKLLYQIYDGQNRKLVKLDQIPQNLVNATIAIEDKNFFTHPGVDFFGIVRAFKSNISHGEIQGGSTITQQLIKNTLLTPDQTYSRKIKEILLAFWAERVFTKKDILQMYFNEVPYGGTAWGAEAAAQTYFGKSVSELNLAESAYLAGLPAAPTEYSPFGDHPEKGKERQKEVLQRMVEDGYISQKEADDASNYQLTFALPHQDIKAPHFVMYIRSLLTDKYGARTVAQGGLKVITTLDLNVQQMAEDTVYNDVQKIQNLNVTNGAAMITDAKTGQILAMVGSKDYYDSRFGNFNVTLALRQPGSSIKPITYATAFKQGFSPGSVIFDTPTTFTNSYGSTYSPVNYDGKFHGPVTIRTALASSYNIPAVKTLGIVGIPAMLQTAQDVGVTSLTRTDIYGLSLTLGGGEVPMIQMMSAYNTFSQNGVRYPIQGILTVTDANGIVLEDNTHPDGKQALLPEIAYLITNILSDNKAREPAFGPKSLLEIPGHTVAVKTGTTDDKRDNWAFGYTPEYVVGAWVGNPDNSPMNPALTSGVTGASQIWHDLMTYMVSNRPDIAFQRPPGIIEAIVDGHKDLAISGQVLKSAVAIRRSPSATDSGTVYENITYSQH